MPMKSLTLSAAVIALVGSFAHAAPPVVTVSPSNGGSASLFERGDGSYIIGIHITNISGSTNVTIRPGANNQVIHSLNVLHDQSTNNATFNIAKNGSNTFGVLRLMGWDARNTGNVYIAELRTSGNVGTVEVNSIFDLDDTSIDIGGDVTSRIKMIKAPIDLPTAQLEARIRGNLLGVIDGPDGTNWGFSIERLVVDQDIGTSTAQTNIWPRGNIKRLNLPTSGGVPRSVGLSPAGARRSTDGQAEVHRAVP